jgi:hypothetical protein
VGGGGGVDRPNPAARGRPDLGFLPERLGRRDATLPRKCVEDRPARPAHAGPKLDIRVVGPAGRVAPAITGQPSRVLPSECRPTTTESICGITGFLAHAHPRGVFALRVYL